MVDITSEIEQDYVSVETVKGAIDRRVVFLDGGNYIETKFGSRLQFEVQIDKKSKTWIPNRDTLRNLAEKFGMETSGWVGKVAMLSTSEKNGKKFVVGFPI